jgi:predicted RNA binding protein YcfA (HicA-like mRNA interferase family)
MFENTKHFLSPLPQTHTTPHAPLKEPPGPTTPCPTQHLFFFFFFYKTLPSTRPTETGKIPRGRHSREIWFCAPLSFRRLNCPSGKGGRCAIFDMLQMKRCVLTLLLKTIKFSGTNLLKILKRFVLMIIFINYFVTIPFSKRCDLEVVFFTTGSHTILLHKDVTIPFFKRCDLEVVFFTTGSHTILLHKDVTIPFFKRCELEVVFFTTGSHTILLHKDVTIPFFKRCDLEVVFFTTNHTPFYYIKTSQFHFSNVVFY